MAKRASSRPARTLSAKSARRSRLGGKGSVGELWRFKARPSDAQSWADFWELATLEQNGMTCSAREAVLLVNKHLPVARLNGDKARDSAGQHLLLPEKEEHSEIRREMDMDGAATAIQERAKHCGTSAPTTKYPFELLDWVNVLKPSRKLRPNGSRWHHVYVFMLLATRLSMTGKKAKSDTKSKGNTSRLPTEMFEELCVYALCGHLGSRSRGMRFGAGSDNAKRMAERVKALCVQLGEGAAKPHHEINAPQTKDGKLDVVVWLGFQDDEQITSPPQEATEENPRWQQDDRPGKKLFFAQCKTGTSYETKDASALDPANWCVAFLRDHFAAPAKHINTVFMVADRPPAQIYRELVLASGLVFDRCNILFSLGDSWMRDPQAQALHADICAWVEERVLALGFRSSRR